MKWIKKTMVRRVLSMVLLFIVVAFGIYGYIVNEQIGSYVDNSVKEGLYKDSNQISTEIESFLERYIVIAEQMSTNKDFITILEDVDDRYAKREHPLYSQIVEQLMAIKDTDSNISLVFIGLADVNDLITDMYDYDAAPDYDLRSRGWYEETIKTGKTIVTAPYIDGVTGQMIVSVSTPIMKNGKDIGAVAIDVLIDEIGTVMSGYQVGETGFATLIDKEGTFVYHPDSSLIIDAKITDLPGVIAEVGQEMINGNTGIREYQFNGQDRIIAYNTVQNTGWGVGTIIPRQEAISDAVKFMQLTRIILIVTILFVLIFLSFIIKKNLSPIPKILEGIKHLSEGDMTFSFETDRNDEIGMINKGLQIMQNNVTALIKDISDKSYQVASSSEELTATSNQTSTAAAEVANAIEEIARGATNQAEDTGRGAENINDMGSLVENDKIYRADLNKSAQEINKLKEEGLIVIKDLVTKTDLSNEASKEVMDIINKTNGSAEEIEIKSRSIKSIAEQTNLLALNASIEAARAGEAGRGFAVVADEIRKLAEESNSFTGEIDSIINDLTGRTEHAVIKMSEVEELTKQQTKEVELTNQKFNGIANSIKDILKVLENLNNSGDLMNSKKNEIIEIIESLSAISQENAAGTQEASASVEEQTAAMEEIANASESLSRLAEEMEESISKFKLE